MKGKINNILWDNLDIHREDSRPVSPNLLDDLVGLFEKEKKKAIKEALESVRVEFKEIDPCKTFPIEQSRMYSHGWNECRRELDNKINKILDETTN